MAVEEIRARIEKLRQGRGFLLPHHGAMATAAPDLQDGYFHMYQALTQTPRHLTGFERETVWLAILIAAKEGVGTHHLELFFEEGGSQGQAAHLTSLTSFAMGSEAFAFLDEAWSDLLPAMNGTHAYVTAFEAIVDDSQFSKELSHLAMAALHAAQGRHWGLEAHIKAIYASTCREDALVEALSLIMWPTGVNHFLDACGVWLSMMQNGKITPSERYRVWAETPAQTGHRGASKRRF
jgi:alkylhydroperoxidase/carboxymuconolactone decarboxylase family protein YurZ